MTYQTPAPLRPGDLLYVVATSGALRELTAFEQGIEIWQSRGYRVERCPGYDDSWGYLAGTDAARRAQLLMALQDPDCRGVLCARGGYGGTRLLENWRWPDGDAKWLIGFSDITSLLWSQLKQGISGVHGPLLTTLSQEPDWSTERLFNWVAQQTLPPLQGEGWVAGRAVGQLLPANLTVATCLLGTPHEPDLSGTILAFEDVTEAPYRLDRMLTHWRMLGRLEQVRGVALGRFSHCEAPRQPSFTALEVLRERLSDLNIPVVANLPFGHDGVNAALPVGLEACLDGTTGQISFPSYESSGTMRKQA
ncbi:MAG: LD-carboxypeptidase [Leptolyngbya sp. SIO4C1]|nr:LD-carboxypeptidase [Leptolyngbya sp. SIO4C1]